jgi:thioredoxin 1
MQGNTTAGDAIYTVGSSTFESVVLAATGPVTVEFMSYSCMYCRAIEAALQEVAQRLGPEHRMYRVNIALEPELAADYGVQGTPTLVTFLHGAEIARAEGPPPEPNALLQTILRPLE